MQPWPVVDALCRAAGREPQELEPLWEAARRTRIERRTARRPVTEPPAGEERAAEGPVGEVPAAPAATSAPDVATDHLERKS